MTAVPLRAVAVGSVVMVAETVAGLIRDRIRPRIKVAVIMVAKTAVAMITILEMVAAVAFRAFSQRLGVAQ